MRRVVVLFAVLSIACLAKPTINLGPNTPPSSRLSADAAAIAFRQGIDAYALGVAESACPYSGDDARRAWRSGWRWARGK